MKSDNCIDSLPKSTHPHAHCFYGMQDYVLLDEYSEMQKLNRLLLPSDSLPGLFIVDVLV